MINDEECMKDRRSSSEGWGGVGLKRVGKVYAFSFLPFPGKVKADEGKERVRGKAVSDIHVEAVGLLPLTPPCRWTIFCYSIVIRMNIQPYPKINIIA